MLLPNFQLLFMAFLSILLITSVLGHGGGDEEEEEEPSSSKLLVISLDGFRHDFVDRGMPNLMRLSQQGVRAKGMTSSYITVTFPNHWSMVTGLYEESHGIVANVMLNTTTNATFSHCSNMTCSSWYGGEPIWNTNEFSNEDVNIHRVKRHGGSDEEEEEAEIKPLRHSGVIYWPGIGTRKNNHSITFSNDWQNDEALRLTFRQRLDRVLSWFLHEETPINLGLVYYEQPDAYCHPYGPESQQVTQVLGEIDEDLGYLMERLEEPKLRGLNLMIVSDHGFADLAEPLYLEDCIDSSKYRLVDNNPVMSIWPHDTADTDELFDNLTQCDGLLAFKKGGYELVHKHYSNNERISPIIVTTPARPGSPSARSIVQKRPETPPTYTDKGKHGWNNTWEKMHAVFIAKGPSFKHSYTRDTFENVNLYPLMCSILGITDHPPVNGSIANIHDVLLKSGIPKTFIIYISLALFCAAVGSMLIIGACRRQFQVQYSYNGHSINNPLMSLVRGKSLNSAENSTLLATSDEEF